MYTIYTNMLLYKFFSVYVSTIFAVLRIAKSADALSLSWPTKPAAASSFYKLCFNFKVQFTRALISHSCTVRNVVIAIDKPVDRLLAQSLPFSVTQLTRCCCCWPRQVGVAASFVGNRKVLAHTHMHTVHTYTHCYLSLSSCLKPCECR